MATSLSMLMYNIHQRPEIYKKFTEEIRTVFKSSDEIGSVEAAAQCPWLNACIQESLRVTPTVPGPHWRRNPVAIEVAGVTVPPNIEVGVSRYSIYRSPLAFHDPESFKPERWIEDLGDNLEISKPFGVGPRSCIGKNIAMVEIRVIMAKMLWMFDWKLLTRNYDPKDYFVLYKEPMLLQATPRVLV